MKCLLANKTAEGIQTVLTETPPPKCVPGSVLIQVQHSSINYKDALAVTGKGAILRQFPLIPGIDCAGTVVESQSKQFSVGQTVLVTGCGLGETHNGGYAQVVLENEENVIALPKGLNPRKAMILGTAGFTAALAVERMLVNGQTPRLGKVVVTGASGGVGQFAIRWLALQGFDVLAVSGKPGTYERLKEIGATQVIDPKELPSTQAPLGSVQWGGGIDNVGGQALQSLLTHCQLWGNVASIGLASSAKLESTVMPFILRGVSLLGISSNNTPRNLREKIWQDFGKNAAAMDLESFVTAEIGLSEVVAHSEQMLARKTAGRTLVNLE